MFVFSVPIANRLSRMYGHKIIGFIGVALVSIGLAICSIKTSLTVVYTCYGILSGKNLS